MAEADVAAQRLQLPAQADQQGLEVVGAHMGLGLPEDALRRAVAHQGLQDEAVAHVPGAGVQFAVREGPGPALPELDVGGGVQRSGVPEALHVPPPALHVPAPLQEDGPRAAPGQGQGAEQSPRPRSHHHRRRYRRGNRPRQAVGGLLHRGHPPAFAAPQNPPLVLHGHPQGVDKAHSLPCVHRPAENPEIPERRFRHPQFRRRLAAQKALVLVERQFNSLNLQHAAPPPPACRSGRRSAGRPRSPPPPPGSPPRWAGRWGRGPGRCPPR